MNILFLNNKRGYSRTLRVPKHWPWILGSLLVALPIALGVTAYLVTARLAEPDYAPLVAGRFAEQIEQQSSAIKSLDRQSNEQFRALTLKLAQAQARLVRLDALGERLVEVAQIGDGDEFDFSTVPGLGGPEENEGAASYQPPSFMDAVDQMTATLERRERQLDILNNLMADRELKSETFLSGRPLTKGWMSSRFGRRSDPFTGKIAWHKGVDFAGKEDTDIIATGAGVVTYAGERSGYGKLVEINHGDGMATRYGHAKTLLVEPGDIVRIGDAIARVGSSGRSTGPHVHYEVLKNQRQVNPQPYIYRARR